MRLRMCPAVRIGTRRAMIRRTKARALKLPTTHPSTRARLLPSYQKSRRKRTEKRKRERETPTHYTHTYNRHWTGTGIDRERSLAGRAL